VHLGHYGLDLSRSRPKAEWTRLWHLLEALGRVPGDFRIRLSSLEAAEARDDLIRAMADNPRICPHLHLCLQSGSDRVLRAMKRRYTVAGYLERVRRLRAELDCPALTTDVIVGFPGETDADFESTLSVVREAGFCKVHVFSYSGRAGTPAAQLTSTVAPQLVDERCNRLRELGNKLTERYCRGLVGRVLDVLVEGAEPSMPGAVRGTSCRYVPISFRGHLPALLRRRVSVRAIEWRDGILAGEPEPNRLASRAHLSENRRIALPLLA
jgi:threonylcarbamoyladenosine tRNA methylthiotransferase MtaB